MKKYALITGASSGIGLAMAEVFASHKINLILVARTLNALETLKRTLEKQYGIDVIVLSKDLSNPQSAQDIYDFVTAEKLHVEYLINNAGFGDYCVFVDSDIQRNQDMIHVNILSLTALSRYFGADMKSRHSGKIVNIASTAAFQAGPYMAVYFASKAYVSSFSLALAKELEDYNVSVTTIYPGPTTSNFDKNANAKGVSFFKGNLPTSKDLALFTYKNMMAGKKRAIHGFANKMQVFAMRFLPTELVLSIMGKIMKIKN